MSKYRFNTEREMGGFGLDNSPIHATVILAFSKESATQFDACPDTNFSIDRAEKL